MVRAGPCRIGKSEQRKHRWLREHLPGIRDGLYLGTWDLLTNWHPGSVLAGSQVESADGLHIQPERRF